jgi:diguanylate cyclase (GGDEF)-like protein/PAS domain S-box-containing protein
MPERFLATPLPQHEAAELYRLMVVGIREVAVFLMDPGGYITVWNRGAQDMQGFRTEDVLGSHLGMLYTEADCAAGRPNQHLQMAAENGCFSEDSWRMRKDGSLFWGQVSLTALRDKNNILLGFSAVTLDLTRHQQLEQCNKEREEIDMILQAADSGSWKWNVERGDVVISTHLMHLLGYNDGAPTLSFDHWLSFVHRDDRAAFRARLDHARLHPESTPIETELRFRGMDASFHWFFLRANWHADGHPGRELLGVCVAIDSLKAAEHDKQELVDTLSRERARFANILEQLPSGVLLADSPSGKLTYQNRAASELLGRSIDHVDSVAAYMAFHFTDLHGARIACEDLPLSRTVRDRVPVSSQDLIYQRDDGQRLHFAVTTSPITDTDGVARIAVAVVHDITSLKRAELAAASEKERALVTLAAITDGVVTADRDGRITSVNPAAERMTGVAQQDALCCNFYQMLHFHEEGGADVIIQAIERCLKDKRVVANLPHLTMLSRDGHHFSVESAVAPVCLDNGELIGAVLIFHDVTESKRLMRRLGFEASHDALTGLVNRREFELRLTRALERARTQPDGSAALLYMDLDQFKIVNDTCGHSAGDDLLKLLASSYSEHVRERDTLARIGGDEFALIVEHCDVDEAMAVAQKILDATRNFRYPCKGQLFQLGVSIGLTPIDRSTTSVEEAMRRADHACYIAKERGRNRVFVHYHGDLDFAQRRSDMHWVTRLTHAFQNDQLQLYCQPIQSLATGSAKHHVEILLRLRNGRAGPVMPGTFLPAAERYDVILKIDRWVLKRTLEWLSAHKDVADALDMCSINISRRSLTDATFHAFAAELIDASDVPATKLCFEITEHGAIADMQKTISFIEAMSARGCRFSLDDFGIGMTSFSYLKQLPVNFIKIDGSFIQMMSSSEVDYEMVRFTNDISHMMGRQTIAEYVSDDAILASLRQIGVDFAQGYCIGKPRPLSSFAMA